MAIRFEKPFGLNADTLCRLQTTHAPAAARRRRDERFHTDLQRS
jgi:plasmid maintenance system antidote protein VapI